MSLIASLLLLIKGTLKTKQAFNTMTYSAKTVLLTNVVVLGVVQLLYLAKKKSDEKKQRR